MQLFLGINLEKSWWFICVIEIATDVLPRRSSLLWSGSSKFDVRDFQAVSALFKTSDWVKWQAWKVSVHLWIAERQGGPAAPFLRDSASGWRRDRPQWDAAVGRCVEWRDGSVQWELGVRLGVGDRCQWIWTQWGEVWSLKSWDGNWDMREPRRRWSRGWRKEDRSETQVREGKWRQMRGNKQKSYWWGWRRWSKSLVENATSNPDLHWLERAGKPTGKVWVHIVPCSAHHHPVWQNLGSEAQIPPPAGCPHPGLSPAPWSKDSSSSGSFKNPLLLKIRGKDTLFHFKLISRGKVSKGQARDSLLNVIWFLPAFTLCPGLWECWLARLFSKTSASIGAVSPGFGMWAGKLEVLGTKPQFWQLCSSDFRDRLKKMSVMMVSEATRIRFAGAHLLSPPVNNPSWRQRGILRLHSLVSVRN